MTDEFPIGAARRKSPRTPEEQRFFVIALGPLLVVLVIASLAPFLVSAYLSFTNYSFSLPGHNGAFVGAENYVALASDSRFWDSLLRQLLFSLVTIPCQLGLGLIVTLALWRTRWGSSLLLLAIAIPLILAPVTIGMIWRLMLHGDYGVIGYAASKATGVSLLGSPATAFWAIVAVDVWQWTPFFVVILFTALRSLPSEVFIAAEIDGAAGLKKLFTITLPLLTPALLLGVLIRLIDSFKEFDKTFVMTHGGPASTTEFLSLFTWITAFEHGDLGLASAVSTVGLLVVYVACSAMFTLARRDWRLQ